MESLPPPPIIQSTRVLYYALVDASVRYTRRTILYVDGAEIDPVPRLAIARNLADDDILLLHCDEQWNCLGVSGSGDVDAVLNQANLLYDGISTKWSKAPYRDVDYVKAIADDYASQRCSFCGCYHFELDGELMAEGRDAAICSRCVQRLHSAMSGEGADQSGNEQRHG